LILEFAGKYTVSIGKNSSIQSLEKLIDKCAVAVIAIYFLVIFLIFLEKFIIKRSDSENIYPKWNIWRNFFIISTTLLAIVIRVVGFPQTNPDVYTQLDWTSCFRDNGFFEGYRTFPGNYNAIYMYMLSFLAFLPSKLELTLMKTFSCIFDFICAIYAMKIVIHLKDNQQQLPPSNTNKKIGLLTYAVVLFSPTVFINSGTWGQSESMHTAFIFMSLYYLLKNKIPLAMIFFGIALSFKLQAIFPLTFILIFFIYKKISYKNLLFIPLGLAGVSMPAWLFGWPLPKLFTNYLNGTNTDKVTWNAPTIYTLEGFPSMVPVVFIITALFCLGFLIIKKRSTPSTNTLLLLFLFCNFAVPFFLPNMHERYFYIGEIAVLLYVIINPARYWISFLVIIPAILTYSGYLADFHPFPLLHLTGVMLLAVIFITKWLIESILLDQKEQLG
jgi:Gpi18-like mannosyltransferase